MMYEIRNFSKIADESLFLLNSDFTDVLTGLGIVRRRTTGSCNLIFRRKK